jgi:hypothetical protein
MDSCSLVLHSPDEVHHHSRFSITGAWHRAWHAPAPGDFTSDMTGLEHLNCLQLERRFRGSVGGGFLVFLVLLAFLVFVVIALILPSSPLAMPSTFVHVHQRRPPAERTVRSRCRMFFQASTGRPVWLWTSSRPGIFTAALCGCCGCCGYLWMLPMFVDEVTCAREGDVLRGYARPFLCILGRRVKRHGLDLCNFL